MRMNANRLLYRSKQRGLLELDLILDKWVEENLHYLDESRIRALIQVLDMGCDTTAPVPVANGVLNESNKVKSYEEFDGPSKIEKEEGELSPNGDSEEDNFVGYGDSNAQSMAKSKHNIEIRKYQSRNGEDESCPDAGGDNDAYADDEENENVSEASEDDSGSEN